MGTPFNTQQSQCQTLGLLIAGALTPESAPAFLKFSPFLITRL